MSLYTIILEYMGGTYISQVNGDSEKSALQWWAGSLDEKVTQVASIRRKELAWSFRDEEPIALSGTVNAWCASAIVSDELVLINIIKTDSLID